MRVEDAVKLPKSHPARFLALYGSRPQQTTLTDDTSLRRWIWEFQHPFGADLAACAETNS